MTETLVDGAVFFIIIFFFGCIIFYLGCCWAIEGFGVLKSYLSTRPVKISQVSDKQSVRLRGRVVAGDKKQLVCAPFSQRNVVWYQILVEEYQTSTVGTAKLFHRLLAENKGHDFSLDDGSGMTVHIRPQDANIEIEHEIVAESSTMESAPEHIQKYLEPYRLESKPAFGYSVTAVRFKEAVLAENDQIGVFGSVMREAGASSSESKKPHEQFRLNGENGFTLTNMNDGERVVSGILKMLAGPAIVFMVPYIFYIYIKDIKLFF